jgi:hypothetical protein
VAERRRMGDSNGGLASRAEEAQRAEGGKGAHGSGAAHIYRGGTGEEQERVMGEGRAREEGKQLQRGRPSARERWQ